MADFDDNENMLNQSENKFNSVGIMRDSDNQGRNTVSVSNFAESSQKKRKGLNQTLNVQNKIAQNLANDSQEEPDENNDAEPEELYDRDPDDMNKTLDDIFVLKYLENVTQEKNMFHMSQKMPNFSIGFYTQCNMDLFVEVFLDLVQCV